MPNNHDTTAEADGLANDLRYLVKLMDWAAGEGFCRINGMPDPDEAVFDMWKRYDPEKGDGDYSADVLSNLMVARLTAENARQAAEIEGLIAAGNELSDKLWVLRCNSRDDKDREAAEKAYDMWTEARRPRALTGGQP